LRSIIRAGLRGEKNMIGRITALATIAAGALAMPAAAQGPAIAAFDGRYVGVSIEVSKAGSHSGRCPAVNGKPAPLVITNGVARTPGKGGWEGTVSPQGIVVMHNPNSLRVDARIEPQGTIRGQYSGPSCIFTYVWRKQSG
jgi:hypothetical protein